VGTAAYKEYLFNGIGSKIESGKEKVRYNKSVIISQTDI